MRNPFGKKFLFLQLFSKDLVKCGRREIQLPNQTIHMFDGDLLEAKQPPAEHVHRQRQFLDDLNEANLLYLLGQFEYLLPTSSQSPRPEHRSSWILLVNGQQHMKLDDRSDI